MTSQPWFLVFWRPLSSSLRPRQHIEERPVDYWFLPSSTPAFLAAKRLISEPIGQIADVADKHARYMAWIAT